MRRFKILDILGVLFLVILVGSTAYYAANKNILQIFSPKASTCSQACLQSDNPALCGCSQHNISSTSNTSNSNNSNQNNNSSQNNQNAATTPTATTTGICSSGCTAAEILWNNQQTGKIGYQYSNGDVAGFYKQGDKYYPIAESAGGPTQADLAGLVQQVTQQNTQTTTSSNPASSCEQYKTTNPGAYQNCIASSTSTTPQTPSGQDFLGIANGSITSGSQFDSILNLCKQIQSQKPAAQQFDCSSSYDNYYNLKQFALQQLQSNPNQSLYQQGQAAVNQYISNKAAQNTSTNQITDLAQRQAGNQSLISPSSQPNQTQTTDLAQRQAGNQSLLNQSAPTTTFVQQIPTPSQMTSADSCTSHAWYWDSTKRTCSYSPPTTSIAITPGGNVSIKVALGGGCQFSSDCDTGLFCAQSKTCQKTSGLATTSTAGPKYASKADCESALRAKGILPGDNGTYAQCNQYISQPEQLKALDTLTMGQFTNYVSAFQQPYTVAQAAGQSSDAYIRNCISQGKSAYACMKQATSLTPQAAGASINLGTTLTAEGAFVYSGVGALEAAGAGGVNVISVGANYLNQTMAIQAEQSTGTYASCVVTKGANNCAEEAASMGVSWLNVVTLGGAKTIQKFVGPVGAKVANIVTSGANTAFSAYQTAKNCTGQNANIGGCVMNATFTAAAAVSGIHDIATLPNAIVETSVVNGLNKGLEFNPKVSSETTSIAAPQVVINDIPNINNARVMTPNEAAMLAQAETAHSAPSIASDQVAPGGGNQGDIQKALADLKAKFEGGTPSEGGTVTLTTARGQVFTAVDEAALADLQRSNELANVASRDPVAAINSSGQSAAPNAQAPNQIAQLADLEPSGQVLGADNFVQGNSASQPPTAVDNLNGRLAGATDPLFAEPPSAANISDPVNPATALANNTVLQTDLASSTTPILTAAEKNQAIKIIVDKAPKDGLSFTSIQTRLADAGFAPSEITPELISSVDKEIAARTSETSLAQGAPAAAPQVRPQTSSTQPYYFEQDGNITQGLAIRDGRGNWFPGWKDYFLGQPNSLETKSGDFITIKPGDTLQPWFSGDKPVILQEGDLIRVVENGKLRDIPLTKDGIVEFVANGNGHVLTTVNGKDISYNQVDLANPEQGVITTALDNAKNFVADGWNNLIGRGTETGGAKNIASTTETAATAIEQGSPGTLARVQDWYDTNVTEPVSNFLFGNQGSRTTTLTNNNVPNIVFDQPVGSNEITLRINGTTYHPSDITEAQDIVESVTQRTVHISPDTGNVSFTVTGGSLPNEQGFVIRSANGDYLTQELTWRAPENVEPFVFSKEEAANILSNSDGWQTKPTTVTPATWDGQSKVTITGPQIPSQTDNSFLGQAKQTFNFLTKKPDSLAISNGEITTSSEPPKWMIDLHLANAPPEGPIVEFESGTSTVVTTGEPVPGGVRVKDANVTSWRPKIEPAITFDVIDNTNEVSVHLNGATTENQISINGTPLTPTDNISLHPGDRITIGNQEIVFNTVNDFNAPVLHEAVQPQAPQIATTSTTSQTPNVLGFEWNGWRNSDGNIQFPITRAPSATEILATTPVDVPANPPPQYQPTPEVVRATSEVIHPQIMDPLVTQLEQTGSIKDAKVELTGRMWDAYYDKTAPGFQKLSDAGGDVAANELRDRLDAALRQANPDFIYSPKSPDHITYPDISTDRISSIDKVVRFLKNDAPGIIEEVNKKYGEKIDPNTVKLSDYFWLGLGQDTPITFTNIDGVMVQQVQDPIQGALLGAAGKKVPESLTGGNYLNILENRPGQTPDISVSTSKNIMLEGNVLKESDLSLGPANQYTRTTNPTDQQISDIANNVGFDTSFTPEQIAKHLSPDQVKILGVEPVSVDLGTEPVIKLQSGDTKTEIQLGPKDNVSVDGTPFSDTKTQIKNANGENSPEVRGFDTIISHYLTDMANIAKSNGGNTYKFAGDGTEMVFLDGITPKALRDLVDGSNSLSVNIAKALNGDFGPEAQAAAKYLEESGLKDKLFVKVGAITTDTVLTIHQRTNGYLPTEVKTAESTDPFLNNSKVYKQANGIDTAAMSISPELAAKFTPAELKAVGLELVNDPNYGTFLKLAEPPTPPFTRFQNWFDDTFIKPANDLLFGKPTAPVSEVAPVLPTVHENPLKRPNPLAENVVQTTPAEVNGKWVDNHPQFGTQIGSGASKIVYQDGEGVVSLLLINPNDPVVINQMNVYKAAAGADGLLPQFLGEIKDQKGNIVGYRLTPLTGESLANIHDLTIPEIQQAIKDLDKLHQITGVPHGDLVEKGLYVNTVVVSTELPNGTTQRRLSFGLDYGANGASGATPMISLTPAEQQMELSQELDTLTNELIFQQGRTKSQFISDATFAEIKQILQESDNSNQSLAQKIADYIPPTKPSIFGFEWNGLTNSEGKLQFPIGKVVAPSEVGTSTSPALPAAPQLLPDNPPSVTVTNLNTILQNPISRSILATSPLFAGVTIVGSEIYANYDTIITNAQNFWQNLPFNKTKVSTSKNQDIQSQTLTGATPTQTATQVLPNHAVPVTPAAEQLNLGQPQKIYSNSDAKVTLTAAQTIDPKFAGVQFLNDTYNNYNNLSSQQIADIINNAYPNTVNATVDKNNGAIFSQYVQASLKNSSYKDLLNNQGLTNWLNTEVASWYGYKEIINSVPNSQETQCVVWEITLDNAYPNLGLADAKDIHIDQAKQVFQLASETQNSDALKFNTSVNGVTLDQLINDQQTRTEHKNRDMSFYVDGLNSKTTNAVTSDGQKASAVFAHKLTSLNGVKPGDAIVYGNHMAPILNIDRDQNGNVVSLLVSEANSPKGNLDGTPRTYEVPASEFAQMFAPLDQTVFVRNESMDYYLNWLNNK